MLGADAREIACLLAVPGWAALEEHVASVEFGVGSGTVLSRAMKMRGDLRKAARNFDGHIALVRAGITMAA